MAEPLDIRLHRTGPIRALYEWMMRRSGGPHAFWFLGVIAFAESWVFPIPPDVLLVPMVLAQRRRAFVLAGWCTLMSVLGGMFGYAVGALLWSSIGHWLIEIYGYGRRLDGFRQLYVHWGAAIILLKGLTPIPYKLVTIASGFAGFNFALFVLLSTLTRGARFLLVATLLFAFGEPMRDFIECKLELLMLAVLGTIAAGFVIARYAA